MKVLFRIAILALVFFIGAYLGQATFKPRTVTIYRTEVKYQPIKKVAVETDYIERVVEVPVKLHHFADVEEVKQWLKGISFLFFEVVDSKTGHSIYKPDCEDYALELQRKALADGYLMSFEIIHSSEYNQLFSKRLPHNTLHAINLVVIGNDAYYIEPQTHEVVLGARLD